MGRQTDAALFSGKRMDDDEEITYTARGVAADPDDVLFSGNRATQPEYDEYDPLLNGAPITEPVAVAAAATTATQSWAAPVEPVTQTPPVASVDVPPAQPTVARQPVPGPQTGEPVIAPAPEGYPQQSQYAQPAVQYNEPLQQPVQPQQPYYAPAAEQPAQQPYYAPAPEQPVAGNAWQAEEQQSTFAPQSTYQTEQTYQQPAAQEPLYQQPQPVEQQPVVEPEPVVEETKPARPPLYYFEEVEEKRAREREQLAAWYQPIPEPVKEPEPIKSSLKAPSVAAVPPVEAAAAVSPLASGVKKRHWRRGLPQPLPRQSSVWQIAVDRVLRSKRGLVRSCHDRNVSACQLVVNWRLTVLSCPHSVRRKKKPVKPSAISTILAISTTMMKSMRCSRMNWLVSSPRHSSNAMANSINMMCP